MTVEIDVIARAYGCDEAGLKLALPLISQGYLPPYLARYRRDELSGAAEAPLWALASAVERQQKLDERRTQLRDSLDVTVVDDVALGQAIRDARSHRDLDRLSRAVRSHNTALDPKDRLAVRILNPQPDDSADPAKIAEKIFDGDPSAAEKLAEVLPKALAENQQLIRLAADWLSRNVKIRIGKVHDPHVHAENSEPSKEGSGNVAPPPNPGVKKDEPKKKGQTPDETADSKVAGEGDTPADQQTQASKIEPAPTDAPTINDGGTATPNTNDVGNADSTTENPETPAANETATINVDANASVEAEEKDSAAAQPASEPAAQPDGSESDTKGDPGQVVTDKSATAPSSHAPEADAGQPTAGQSSPDENHPSPGRNQRKKVSPRQRRRRWLLGILEPLSGKKFVPNKLSAFQIVMLAKGLRSSIVEASFDYDRAKLVEHLLKAAKRLNPGYADQIIAALKDGEAGLCAAAEEVFWDRQLDRASARLMDISTSSFRDLVMRQPVATGTVIAVDAVGPKTAALVVLNPTGEVVHTEDIPCQLSKTLREQMVTRLGEICHTFHVKSIVVSNGPARRNCLVGLAELLEQSQPGSIHWTLADRSGADLFSSADASDPKIRRLPRRFRAAAWIGMQLLDPVSAYSKIDYTRLRLASYQRELNGETLGDSLTCVLTSGISGKGGDLNGSDVDWLSRLPGVSRETATAIDARRRKGLFASRAELQELDSLSEVDQRQMVPFLRVFGGEQPLDATLIHPDDYRLAEKLCSALDIPVPEPAPPGYQPPNYGEESSVQEEAATGENPASDASLPIETPTNTEFAATIEPTDAGSDNSDESKDSNETTAPEPASESEEPTAETAAAEVESEQPAVPSTEGPDAGAEGEPAVADTASDDAQESPEPAGDAQSKEADAAPVPPPAPEMPRHPLPESSKIAKVIKEWQVGKHRVHQIVHWLCEPFSVPSMNLKPQALMGKVPKLNELKPGDLVSGVIVGVAKFGVFVELGPDCSGLIHVSRLAHGYVEDPHEFVQVGDVVSAYVTHIETQRRRVALSVLSPDEEKAVADAKSHRGENRTERGGRRPSGGQRSDGGRQGRERGKSGGGKNDNRGRSGAGGRDGGRRDRRGGQRKPETRSFTVKSSKEPKKKISDDMKSGEEPLRSFSDLMQFYQGQTEPPAATPPADSDAQVAKDKQTPAPEPEVKPVTDETQSTDAESVPATPENDNSNTEPDGNQADVAKPQGEE